ncbi:MAG: ribonuclease E/G [Verrucomicrobiales bacterium]
MLKKIKKVFERRKPLEGNKIVINCSDLETRVALLEDGSLEEYSVEREGDVNIVGSIFKGRVKNIEQGLKASFVDIGFEKNAFLHFWDAIPAAIDGGIEEIRKSKKKEKRITSKDIPKIYPVGSEVLVQVTKGAIGTKGPRITTNISLAGRFLVLMPLNDQFGISRKIEDPKERARLRQVMEKLSVPEGMGVIMRTVCQGQRARYFVRDLAMLVAQWDQIEENRESKRAPMCCFEEPDLIERTVRDFLTEEVGEVICDDADTVDRMKKLVSGVSRRARNRVTYFERPEPVFNYYGVESQIREAFLPQVWLKCGGYLVIDETEAMIAVDVNTGRNKGSKNVDKMILETNIEAAREVARQLRLRNIGGLIVVDFIDMRNRRDQQAVYRAIREPLRKDRAKTQVLPISQLGLLEMTRQRLNESLTDSFTESCAYCQGRGIIRTTETMSIELQRRIDEVMTRAGERTKELVIVVHPDVMNRLRTKDDKLLMQLERKHAARFTFRSDPSYHREQVLLSDAKTGDEMK